MSDDKVIDVAEPTMAVAVADKSLPIAAPIAVQQTPAQARIEAVSSVLHSAYQKASLLQLTSEEIKALKADFPDEAFKLGAGGNDQLIYIEFAFLRDRFDEVIGMGQWALVRTRPHWGEDYVTGKGQKATRIYADCALVIRGCLVAEAIGEMSYFHNNATQSYGDAVEGSETAAFRRCAKKFGVGLQAWKKDFCAAWMQKHRNPTAVRVGYEKVSYEKPVPAPAKPKPLTANEAFKYKMILKLKAEPGQDCRNIVTEYFQKIGALIPTEELEDLPLRFVPVSKEEMAALHKAITDFEAGGEAKRAFDPHIEGEPTTKTKQATATQPPPASTDSKDEPWRSFPTPFGKHAGVMLGNLDKNVLFGFWANYTVETHYNGKPKKEETIQKDRIFREMLDAAGRHYDFVKLFI